MPEDTYKTEDLEILVATMYRTSLDFLQDMFIQSGIDGFKILIVNQTDRNFILESDNPRIRIINSFEKGLSKSRNLAINNASGKIGLIADDDVVFVKGFDRIIKNAFSTNPQAGLINFKAQTFSGNPYRKYPQKSVRHSAGSVKDIMSIEIAVNISKIRRNKIFFDERFGLGSEFPTAEEYLFAREVFQKTKAVYFANEYIVAHEAENSGQHLGSPEIVSARAALHYKIYGRIGYIWLLKYVFFLVRKKHINPKDIFRILKSGLKGIHNYKSGLHGK